LLWRNKWPSGRPAWFGLIIALLEPLQAYRHYGIVPALPAGMLNSQSLIKTACASFVVSACLLNILWAYRITF
jgi:hypothetical protein